MDRGSNNDMSDNLDDPAASLQDFFTSVFTDPVFTSPRLSNLRNISVSISTVPRTTNSYFGTTHLQHQLGILNRIVSHIQPSRIETHPVIDTIRRSMEDTGGTKRVASQQYIRSIQQRPSHAEITEEEECQVCMDSYLDCFNEESPSPRDPIQLECGHIFHRECILEWLKGDNRCPICRHEYESKEISLSSSAETVPEEHLPTTSDSLENDEMDTENDSPEYEAVFQSDDGASPNGMFGQIINILDTAIAQTNTVYRRLAPLTDEEMLQRAIYESIQGISEPPDLSDEGCDE